MKKVRVLIVDDSVVYRSQIRAALSSMSNVEVVGAASDGQLALKRPDLDSTDLMILDLEMPGLDGLGTLRELSAHKKRPKVIVFSAHSKRGADITLDALKLGATDFVTKPGPGFQTVPTDPSASIRALLEPKIEALFSDLCISSLTENVQTEPELQMPMVSWDEFRPAALAIGSSTGGPAALDYLFSQLSKPLRVPVFITQHMPPVFTASLAEQLSRKSGLICAEGQDGEAVKPGRVYIAPGDFHMTIQGVRDNATIRIQKDEAINYVRPAVDPLFESVSRVYGRLTLGVVLTGMGADGCEGAKKVKQAGGCVLIQSEASCVVFGMPGAVKRAGAYDREVDLDEISKMINKKISETQDGKFQIRGAS